MAYGMRIGFGSQIRFGWILLLACHGVVRGEEPSTRSQAVREEHFVEVVLPIFQQHCFKCHAGSEAASDFQLDTEIRFQRGGEVGLPVDNEDPQSSLLLQAVRHQSLEMPPRGRLSDVQVAAIEQWVVDGATYPEAWKGDPAETTIDPSSSPSRGKVITQADRSFWAFQPLQDARPPAIDGANTAIDAFIEQARRDASLQGNGRAEPAALLRRLHYDLTGLPPSPEDVAAFAANPSDRPYRAWVDRLLSSPAYGEKWGRHWLDLVRYAETNSYERDGDKPEVWRYRDYVVDSFNDDKPYDRFATEQLAGDELPFSTEGLIATGYYRLGLWDDEPADLEQAFYDELDDIVSTTSQVFLGLTMGCARCHDHKIDPILQRDYYSFASFFGGIERYGIKDDASVAARSLRPLMPSGDESQRQAYLDQREKVMQSIRAIERKIGGDLSPVDRQEFAFPVNRKRLLLARVGRLITREEYDRWLALKDEESQLERTKPPATGQALCITETGPQPRAMHVLLRGNPHVQGDEVQPAFPQVVTMEPVVVAATSNPNTSGRRLALSQWIASSRQPLFARVIVNRIWQHHFGRGLVRTSSDFGYQGARPTHPELLDYLANRLIESGWHLKVIHREILLSDAYRLSSHADEERLRRDPENDHFWRFNPRRLTAEELRDTLHWVAGDWNYQMSGPSVFPFIEDEVKAGQSVPGWGWGDSTPSQQARRSIYMKVKRTLPIPFLSAFDAADSDSSCPVRFATTTPPQALNTLNSKLLGDLSSQMAKALRRECGENKTMQIRLGWQRMTQRDPTDAEIQIGLELLAKLESQPQPAADPLQLVCLALMNLNELAYLD
jgi:hypothetical protein